MNIIIWIILTSSSYSYIIIKTDSIRKFPATMFPGLISQKMLPLYLVTQDWCNNLDFSVINGRSYLDLLYIIHFLLQRPVRKHFDWIFLKNSLLKLLFLIRLDFLAILQKILLLFLSFIFHINLTPKEFYILWKASKNLQSNVDSVELLVCLFSQFYNRGAFYLLKDDKSCQVAGLSFHLCNAK